MLSILHAKHDEEDALIDGDPEGKCVGVDGFLLHDPVATRCPDHDRLDLRRAFDSYLLTGSEHLVGFLFIPFLKII